MSDPEPLAPVQFPAGAFSGRNRRAAVRLRATWSEVNALPGIEATLSALERLRELEEKGVLDNLEGLKDQVYKYSPVLLVMVSETDEYGNGVYIQFPLPEERLFRNQAIEDMLLLFLRNPHREFTVTELRNVTGHGGDTVQTAIRVLEAADLIDTRQEGRKKLISANRDRFQNPDDPLLSIPQEEFRSPVKKFLEEAKERQGDDLVGVILFGSVARGEADRASDIDLQVIVETDLAASRRDLHDVRQEIENQKFDGDRYELQLLVESIESAESYGEKLQEIFSEGITLYATDKLDDVREVVFSGE